MREILFRGKTLLGKWIEGDLLQYLGCGKVHIAQNYKGAGGQEIIPKTVGQYTGLDDKNGNKIFEGDIVLCNRGINDRFDKKTFEIKYDKTIGFYGESKSENIIHADEFYVSEVIGDIHDNPELLEESD